MKLILFFILSLNLVFSFSTKAQEFNDCSRAWRELDWKMVPFIELNARYFSYQFKIPRGKRLNFKIEGVFPYARYFSFHTYNQETEDPMSHLTDFKVEPTSGSVNPFQIGVDRYSPNRYFSAWINSSVELKTDEQKLIIPFDESRDRFVDIWFRIYANENEKIKLPSIQSFDGSFKPTACPDLHTKEWSLATEPGPYNLRVPSESQMGKVPLPFKNGEVHFFRPSTSTLGANMDNRYLSTRLDGKALFSPFTLKGQYERRMLKKHKAILNIGDITAFKFQVSSFPDTKAHLQSFTGEEEVRYWSICVSGEDTFTSGCIMDSEAQTFLGADGKRYAVFVIGPKDSQLKIDLKKAGYNYLDHSKHRVPILFYRQLLASQNFEGSLEKIKPISPNEAKNEQGLEPFFGDTEIGNYSPTGRQCGLTPKFSSSLCGLFSEP